MIKQKRTSEKFISIMHPIGNYIYLHAYAWNKLNLTASHDCKYSELQKQASLIVEGSLEIFRV